MLRSFSMMTLSTLYRVAPLCTIWSGSYCGIGFANCCLLDIGGGCITPCLHLACDKLRWSIRGYHHAAVLPCPDLQRPQVDQGAVGEAELSRGNIVPALL